MSLNIENLKKHFESSNERLDGKIEISTKVNKKRKSLLVLTVTVSNQPSINIYIVKLGDKNEFKPKYLTNVSSLNELDCFETNNQPSYDIEFKYENRTKRVFALKIEEKHNFINRFIRLISFYNYTKFQTLVFCNLPEGKTIEDYLNEKSTVLPKMEEFDTPYLDAVDFNRYQNLTEEEEENLQKFLTKTPEAMINAGEFQEMLRSHMFAMEGTNIHTIMSSEEKLNKLMSSLDHAIQYIEDLEKKVEMHDQFLSEVESSMSCLRDRDQLLQLTSRNREQLQISLSTLLTQLTLDQHHMDTLLQFDISKPQSVMKAQQAASQLQNLLEQPPSQDYRGMKAVHDKQDELNRIADEFGRRIATQFNNALTRHQNQLISTNYNSLDRLLDEHRRRRLELDSYADLTAWLKACRPGIFANLQKVYLEKMANIYDQGLTNVLDVLRHKLTVNRDKSSNNPVSSASQSNLLGKSKQKFNIGLHSNQKDLNASSVIQLPNDPVRYSMADKFEQLFEEFLVKLKPLVIEEEEFMARLFRLDCRRQSERTEVEQKLMSANNVGYEQTLIACSNIVFKKLEDKIKKLIVNLEQQDSSQSLLMIIVVHRQYDDLVYSSEFLMITWGVLYIQTKRSFNSYIDRFTAGFKEVKALKKSRCGILSFVNDYATFAEQTAKSFHDSDRQNDLINAHLKIVREVMNEIERIASESTKAPREVIVMENFHKMKDILRRMKMPELEELQNELKEKYSDALQYYVDSCVGKPFEKLYNFFENVEHSIDRGIRAEEICYQFAFSKAELVRLLKEYPGREVKRGLESLCKRLEKNLSAEAGDLFSVVWHMVQTQFMDAVNRFQNLISRCYPGATGLDLDFTIEELQRYFQEISQYR